MTPLLQTPSVAELKLMLARVSVIVTWQEPCKGLPGSR